MFGIESLTSAVRDLAAANRANTAALLNLTRTVQRLIGPPSPKGKITFHFKGEDMAFNVYDVTLPLLPDVPEAKDVVRGELRLRHDDVDQPAIETAKDQLAIVDLKIRQGITLSGSFGFVDDAGNVSTNPISFLPFKIDDTTPPPDPIGGLAFVAKGEVNE